MNIRFGPTHIKTLIKLQALAEKHNCSITFGTNDDFNSKAEIDGFKPYFKDLTDEIIEDINDKLIQQRVEIKSSIYWFELYDKNTNKYNTLTYEESEGCALYDKGYQLLEEDTETFFEDNGNDWCDYGLDFRQCSQEIRGFENVDKSQINVYREGMLLKFFGDLVCDYLGEERIHEVY